MVRIQMGQREEDRRKDDGGEQPGPLPQGPEDHPSKHDFFHDRRDPSDDQDRQDPEPRAVDPPQPLHRSLRRRGSASGKQAVDEVRPETPQDREQDSREREDEEISRPRRGNQTQNPKAVPAPEAETAPRHPQQEEIAGSGKEEDRPRAERPEWREHGGTQKLEDDEQGGKQQHPAEPPVRGHVGRGSRRARSSSMLQKLHDRSRNPADQDPSRDRPETSPSQRGEPPWRCGAPLVRYDPLSAGA